MPTSESNWKSTNLFMRRFESIHPLDHRKHSKMHCERSQIVGSEVLSCLVCIACTYNSNCLACCTVYRIHVLLVMIRKSADPLCAFHFSRQNFAISMKAPDPSVLRSLSQQGCFIVRCSTWICSRRTYSIRHQICRVPFTWKSHK